jgi:hypothetical protein
MIYWYNEIYKLLIKCNKYELVLSQQNYVIWKYLIEWEMLMKYEK